MSERKRKRGRPRVAPILSYGTELRLRNSIGRNIKKPKYLIEREEEIEESRESTPARSVDTDKSSISGKTKAFRGYNLDIDPERESEYHYGSDFDGSGSDRGNKRGFSAKSSSLGTSDTEESDMEVDYNCDQGDDGNTEFNPFWKLGPAGTLGHRTHTPIPVWLQDKIYPNLNLPKSSEDLLLPNFILFKAIGIYEILRHFQNLLRLSPFRFEDFCASLLSEDQSVLLVEIHITLLKALIREEDSQQTHFGPLDLKDSINIHLYSIDSMTWAEALRLYLHSDKEFLQFLKILNSCQYPFTNLQNRLTILQFLCDHFLQTSPVRENLQNEGKVRYDDHCRVCHKTGDLLCCDSCSAVYHLDCIDPPLTQSPAELEDWTCNICKIHQVEGVTDCLSPMEASGLLCRQEPLGYDRHGRKYWFLIRRIIVESDYGEIWYYSAIEQFDLLQSLVDGTELEEGLNIAFREFDEDIRKQMKTTQKLTDKSRGNRKSILMVDIEKVQDVKNMKVEIKAEDISEQVKVENQVTVLITKPNDISNEGCSNEMKIEKKEPLDDEEKLRILQEKRSQLATTGGKRPPKNDDQLYCLGCDNAYKNYANLYTTNTLALNKLQHNEERDKKRHLSHKFSLGSPVEFKWNGQTHGSQETMIATVRQTLLSLESNISTYFFHPHWPQIRKTWQQAAVASSSPVHFAKLFRWLTVCVKPCVFHTVWNESLGHIQLKRITALERDEKKKQEKRERKEADEEARYYPFIKYTRGFKHQIWKIKGEEYRIHGLWGWAWVCSRRKVCHESMNLVGLRAGPEKITIPIKSSPTSVGAATPSIRGLPINPSAFKQLSAKSPNLKFSILSPEQLKADNGSQTLLHEEKKNEIIITNAGIQQKVEVIQINLEDYFEDGLINVSKNLSSKNRLVYPKLGRISELDSLLSQRVALQIKEEKEISSKKLFGSEKKSEEKPVEQQSPETKPAELVQSEHTENVEELPDSQRQTVHKDRPAGHLLKEMRTFKLKYEALDKLDDGVTCYSKSCRENGRSACYSPSCLLREKVKQKFLNSVNIYKIVTNKPAPFSQVGTNFPITFDEEDKNEKCGATPKDSPLAEQHMEVDENSESSFSSSSSVKHNRVYSSEDTRKKVFLKKLTPQRKKPRSLRLPQITNFKRKSKNEKIDGGHSVMVPAQWELRMLSRRAGKMNVSGFNHAAKTNSAAWPYPCSRPAFKSMWLYRTSTITSVSAAALQLRILWANFKWDDMSEKGPSDGRKQVTTDTEIIQTEILKRKYYGTFLEKTEYLQRKVIIPLDVPKPVREFTPSQRSGLRKRRRAVSPISKQPQSIEIWIDEDKLYLWEIRFFGERLEKCSQLSKKPVQYDKTSDAITSSINSSPLEFKAKLEEQLKLQRANFNQKKSLEGSLSGGIVKLSIGNATSSTNKVTLSGKTIAANSTVVNLPSIISGKKIVTTKGGKIITVQAPSSIGNLSDKPNKLTVGNASVFPVGSLPKVQVTQPGNKILRFQALTGGRQRTILPRGTSPTNIVMPRASTTGINTQTSSGSVATPLRPGGQQIQIFRMPDGQLQVRGLQDGQQVLQRADGKLQLINTKSASGSSTISIPQQASKANPVADCASPTKSVSAVPTGQIVKINGQQLILRTNQNAKKIVTLGNKNTNVADSVVKISPLKTVKTPDSPTKVGLNLQKSNEQPSSNLVTSLAQNTNSITLKVQVRMTEQGPKTIIQGLQPGIVLTKDHIMAIQQQVRTMLTQYNLQVNQLSPLMTLTLHLPKPLPQPGQQVVTKTSPISQTSPLKIAKVERKDTGTILLNQGSETTTGHVKVGGINKLIKKDEKSDPSQGFILTSDYIQQSIKSALKRSDLSPDVEEKLVQLQKYTTENNDGMGLKAEDEALLKSLKRAREDDDEDWLSEELGIKPKTKKIKVEKPVRLKREPQVSAKTIVQDAKKKMAKQLKLDGFLAKHKELLKKDILKKRALLEKELQLRIHKELTLAKQEMDKIKSPEVTVPLARKRTSVDTTPKHNQSSFKKEASISPLSQKTAKNTTPKPKKVSRSKSSKKIVCICRTPFDDSKFYVGCDLCGNWFHGDCVGITVALSRTITEYICDDCANAKLNKELFCICRQPYDETQFYICCERCEDWYHGKCIGIMQVEADDIDDYICPKCEPSNQWNSPCQKKLNNKDYTEVKKLAKALVQHKSAWPFLEPVDQSEVPDYYKVVKEPMDLRTVEKKVNGQQYLNLAQFVGHVMLVFDNCRAYNPLNSSFCTCALTLETFFSGKLKQLKQRLVQTS